MHAHIEFRQGFLVFLFLGCDVNIPPMELVFSVIYGFKVNSAVNLIQSEVRRTVCPEELS